MAHMNAYSSPGFDPFPTLFIERAETEFLDGQGKVQQANVLLPLLTVLSNFSYVMVYSLWLGKSQKLQPYTRKLSILFPK